MERASVSEVKARLSHYLRLVQRGVEVEVLDRGTPVARLVPVSLSDAEALETLVESGVVVPASNRDRSIFSKAPPDIGIDLSTALRAERADRV